ncbi:MAG: DUF4345 domain-containing protein [Desulfomonilia bacterium]
MNKRPLQVTTAILGLVPVITGIITMLGIYDPIYASAGVPRFPLLDSNLRFFGGVWLGLGVAILWLVPSIEKQGTLFRVIWGAIFLGGIGRLLSMVFLGLPPIPFIGFTALEIIGAPLFIYWQYRVAQIYVQSPPV